MVRGFALKNVLVILMTVFTFTFAYGQYVSKQAKLEKNLLVSSSLIGEVYDLENKKAVCDGYVVIDIVNNTAKSYIKCENYQTEGYVG